MIPNEIQILKLSKKSVIAKATEDVKKEIQAAKINPLEKYVLAKTLIDYFTGYVSAIHEEALKEKDKYPEKEILFLNRKVSQFETGIGYDFSECNHPELNELYEKQKALKKDIANIEKSLKLMDKAITVVDDETGETTRICPPLKTSKTSLKISY